MLLQSGSQNRQRVVIWRAGGVQSAEISHTADDPGRSPRAPARRTVGAEESSERDGSGVGRRGEISRRKKKLVGPPRFVSLWLIGAAVRACYRKSRCLYSSFVAKTSILDSCCSERRRLADAAEIEPQHACTSRRL